MSATLVFAARLTPQGRPVEIGARLYAGRLLVDSVGPALVRLPSAYSQDVDRATAQAIGEHGRQLCAIWQYLSDMIASAVDVVVWDEGGFEGLRAFVHGVLGRPGEPRRGITGKRIIGLREAAAPLLRGDRPETWLPTWDDVRELSARHVLSDHLADRLAVLAEIRWHLADTGLLP